MQHLATEDIRHDLAMFLADNEGNCSLAQRFIRELRRRKAPLPVNCRWIYNPYAAFKKSLQFD